MRKIGEAALTKGEQALVVVTRAATVSGFGRLLLGFAVFCCWLYGWVPSLITLTYAGRPRENGSVSMVPLSGQAADAIAIGAAIACGVAILLQVGNLGKVRPAMLFGPLLLWSVLSALHGLGAGPTAFTIPMLIVAWACVRPERQFLYSMVARLGLASALISVVYAFVTPLAFMSEQWSLSAEKAIVGDRILAGPFAHSNVLGLVIALTFPFVVLHFRDWRRWPYVFVMALALLWSASRISLLVAALALVLSILVASSGAVWVRRLLNVTAFVAAIAAVSLPLSTTDPSFLTSRGAIWMAALDFWTASPLLGYGALIFSGQTALTAQITYPSTTGHNIFVTILASGGIVGVLLLVSLYVVAMRRANVAFPAERQPLLFFTVLLLTSIAEDPVRALQLGPTTFLVVPMLVAILDRRQSAGVGAEPDIWRGASRATYNLRPHIN